MNEEIKAASVDSEGFRSILADYYISVQDKDTRGVSAARDTLVAHINAWSDERCNAAINQLAASGAVLPVMDSEQPKAWMRKWAFDGEKPQKERKENGRVAWPRKFKFQAVTAFKIFDDDVPLAALATPVAGWVSVEDERKPAEHELVAVIGPAYGSFDKGRYVSSATYYNGEFFTEDGDMMHPPSHWCALPPAPVVTPTQQEQSNG